MSEWYQVKARVISQKGTCSTGHKVGDEFIIGDTLPAGMCAWAFYSLFPFVAGFSPAAPSPGRKTRTKPPSPARMRKTRWFFN